MKNKFKFFTAILGTALLFSSCRPDKFELGALANKADLKFTIAPSSANPNDIVLTSLTQGLTPVWITPFGQSIKFKDTVNIPFPGTYKFVFGVTSAGGLVQADTTLVTITTIDQVTVSDPMWIKLAGGLGNSKTWVLDLDANAVSKYFNGPFYFGGTGWQWDPAFKDIGWANVSAGDYGTMTFQLKGTVVVEPVLTVTQKNGDPAQNGTFTGSFFLDINAKTITFINVVPLNFGWQYVFTKAYIISLTADGMQLGFKDPVKSEYAVHNYVPK